MGPKKGTAPKSHKLPKQFPPGTVLKDVRKTLWKLGQIIGHGGFGLIYLASANSDQSVTDKSAQFVVKIEPKSNGPLYCEMHFYIRGAKQDDIKNFTSSQKLKYLSVPPFVATGDYTDYIQSYRFLVMPRFGRDLQKLLLISGGTFPERTVFGVGLRMIDALQYLHTNDYVHADIKASNIMLGYSGGKEMSNEVYLCDYGLAYRYRAGGEMKAYQEDPKKAHDGTIEFTSRDAHKGAYPSRRGDLEILGYCMLQWLCGKLPWENNLTDPDYVATQKIRYMNNVKTLIKDCFSIGLSKASDTMLKYMEKISKLQYQEEPDYTYLRTLLRAGLSSYGEKDEWKIDFSTKAKAQKRKSTDASSPVTSPKQRRTSPQKKTPLTNGTSGASTDKIKSPSSKKVNKKPSSPAKKAIKARSPLASPKSKLQQIPPPSKSSPRAKTPQKKSPTKIPPSKSSPRAKTPQKKSPTKTTAPKTKALQIPLPSKDTNKPKSKETARSSLKRKSPRTKTKIFLMPPPSK